MNWVDEEIQKVSEALRKLSVDIKREGAYCRKIFFSAFNDQVEYIQTFVQEDIKVFFLDGGKLSKRVIAIERDGTPIYSSEDVIKTEVLIHAIEGFLEALPTFTLELEN